MVSFIEVTHLWKKVFTKGKYALILLVVAFIFYFLNGLILFVPSIKSFYSQLGLLTAIKLVSKSSLNYASSIAPLTFIAIVVLSLIIGMFISLLVYRFDTLTSVGTPVGVFGAIGIFLGAAAQGCAGCGVGVLSILGFSSVITILPFHGRELLPLAILLTAFSVYSISSKLTHPTCQIHPNIHLKGGKKK